MARAALLCMLALVALAATARADVVHLKDGTTVEGKVVSEDATSVVVDTPVGRQTIERTRVASVERKLAPREDLKEREAALAKEGSAQQWFELAEFAGSKGFKKDRERLLDKALSIDPNHEGANRAKGRVQHEGKWMTPAERDELVKQAEEQKMRDRGLVPFEGRWVTPNEKAHLERGEELVNGKWLAADDAKRAHGLEKLGEEWVAASELVALRRARGFADQSKLPLVTAVGDHVVVATTFGKEYDGKLRAACEKGYGLAAASLREKPEQLAWLGGAKVLAVVLPQRDDFAKFCHFFADDEKKVNQRWADGVAQADGFFWWDPSGTSATFRGSRGLDDTTAHTVHHLGHVLLNRHAYNFKFLPTWLDEGYAAWLEHATLGCNSISCISTRRYGVGLVRKDELMPRATWFDDMRKEVADGKDPAFWPILRKDLTTIEPEEVAKAMVVIDDWIARRPDDFLKLLASLRESWPKGVVAALSPEATAANRKAFEAFGTPAEKVDDELRAQLRATRSGKR